MCYELLSKVVVYAFPKTHNLKVAGSNPAPATKKINMLGGFRRGLVLAGYTFEGRNCVEFFDAIPFINNN